MEPRDFSTALLNLKKGCKVSREGWNGKGMWLALQVPDANSKMRRPYIYMKPVDGDLVPWVASQSDLLAEDWLVVQVSDIDAWVSAEFQRLAEIINEYDHNLFLEMVPVAENSNLIDKSKVFRVVDDRTKKIVLYADSLANPTDILTRLWSMDSTRGNVLARLDARNAAEEALRLKEKIEQQEAVRDFTAFVISNTKSRWTHKGRVRDDEFRDLGPVRKHIV